MRAKSRRFPSAFSAGRSFAARLFKEGFVEFKMKARRWWRSWRARNRASRWPISARSGGKTLALRRIAWPTRAALCEDVLGGKLTRQGTFRRAGLHNIEPRADERARQIREAARRHFDLVSSTFPHRHAHGRRDPDKRWRQLGPGMGALSHCQKNIMESAWRMVKKGGRLVYATCSLLPEENEKQIESFLKEHTDFKLAARARNWLTFMVLATISG